MKRVPRVNVTCATCGTPIQRKQSEIRSDKQYCSRRCAGIGITNTVYKAANQRRRGTTKPKECQICHRSFMVVASIYARTRFCSKECRHKAQSIERHGAANGNYKHGRNQASARAMAMRYFAPKCIVCGWDISVDIHHVIPKSKGGINTPDNLAVLCPNHHRMAGLNLISTDELLTYVQSALSSESTNSTISPTDA
jgi:5-methylcytosine-specific restriction endonuclease McrA